MDEMRVFLYLMLAVTCSADNNGTHNSIDFAGKEKKDKWYLSNEGADITSCGTSFNNACKTFGWLLDRYHNTTASNDNSSIQLVVVTESSIEINQMILETHNWLKRLNVTLGRENENVTENVLLTFTNVTMSRCSWSVIDLNVIAIQSKLSMMTFELENTHNQGEVLFQSSGVGSVQTKSGFNVTIVDSYINGSERLNETAIDVKNGTLFMINTTITKNTISSDLDNNNLLQIDSGFLQIDNCKFLNNTLTTYIINATDSDVSINRSRFSHNTFPVTDTLFREGILRAWNSTLNVNTSLFYNNRGDDLGIVFKLFFSSASLRNSTAKENSAALGGICHVVESHLNSSFCTYANNTSQGSGGTFEMDHSTIISMNDSFVGNKAVTSGGVFELYLANTLHVYKSYFYQNHAKHGGVIHVDPAMKNNHILIRESKMLENSAEWKEYSGIQTYRGAILLVKGDLLIDDCSFVNNSGSFGAIVASDGKFSLHNSTFDGNSGRTGGIIAVVSTLQASMKQSDGNFTGVTIKGCQFRQNEANSISFGIISLKRVHATIKDVVFATNVNTDNEYGIVSLEKTSVSIHNITFDHNTSPRLLYADGSVLDLTGINILEKGPSLALFATSRSSVKLTSCAFLLLGLTPILHLSYDSNAVFYNCSFSNNGLNYDTEKYMIDVDIRSDLYFHSCYFDNNLSLFRVKESVLYVNSSTFNLRNLQSLYCYNSSIVIMNSNFSEITRVRDVNFSLPNRTITLWLPDGWIGEDSDKETSTQPHGHLFSLEFCNMSLSYSFLRMTGTYFTELLRAHSSVIKLYNDSILLSNASDVGEIIDGNLAIDHCVLETPRNVQNRCSLWIKNNTTLRTSVSKFKLKICSYSDTELNTTNTTVNFFTWNTTFITDDGFHLSTASNNKTVIQAISKEFLISHPGVQIEQQENEFASVIPHTCSDNCSCYYSQHQRVNIMNCSSSSMFEMPDAFIPNTNWFILSKSRFTHVCKRPSNVQDLEKIVITETFIELLCDSFIEYLSGFNLQYLDLSRNKLTSISPKIRDIKTLKTLLLGNNNFLCNCDLVWMTDWLLNFTNNPDDNVVKDYKNITCRNGDMVGTSIYLLEPIKLHCYPSVFSTWKIAAIVTACSLVILTILIATIVIKRSREARWLIYNNMNKLIKVEHDVNMDGYEFDGFLSYSNEDMNIMKDVIMLDNTLKPYLEEEHGFMLCIHSRNFLGGLTILTNIDNAVQTSRRMIMFLTKRFLSAQWCMQEFYLAHHKVMNGNPNYLIPVLMEHLNIDELPRDLQTYLRTHTYIDAREYDLQTLRKRIRFSMPDAPLVKLRQRQSRNSQSQSQGNTDVDREEVVLSQLARNDEEDDRDVVRMLREDGSILNVRKMEGYISDTDSDEFSMEFNNSLEMDNDDVDEN